MELVVTDQELIDAFFRTKEARKVIVKDLGESFQYRVDWRKRLLKIWGTKSSIRIDVDEILRLLRHPDQLDH